MRIAVGKPGIEAAQAQQLHEWELIGRYLDRGMAGLLNATPNFPDSAADLDKALAAFQAGFTHEIEAPPSVPADAKKTKAKGPVKKKSKG